MLEDKLKELTTRDIYPFHMPGHKRNPAFAFAPSPVALDVTETPDTDDLHHPTGVLAETMTLAARLAGSRQAWLTVGGSTAGLLAGIAACTHRGDTVLVARNCHRSVAHALALCGVRPVWLIPEWNAALGVYGRLSVETVTATLREHPDAKLLILTSPTYEGVVSDIAAMADAVHAVGATLLVDEAHGAHFGFSPLFPRSAVTLGADVVVQSLHKTLPSPTQTGVVHRCSDRVDAEQLAYQLAVYQTSSPSYLLLCGADRCLRLLTARREMLFAAYERRLTAFRERVKPWLCPIDGDAGKLLIPCENGDALAARLRQEFRIETEMSGQHHVLAMTSVADTDEGFDRLANALERLRPTASAKALPPPPLPPQAMWPCEAADKPYERVSLTEAIGRVAAREVYAYPPGIPLLLAGETLTDALAAHLLALQTEGVELHGLTDNKIAVVA